LPLKRACRKAGPYAFHAASILPNKIENVKQEKMRGFALSDRNLPTIDAAFAVAGLTRTGRLRNRGPRREELTEASVAELRRKSAAPRIAGNGVQWIPIGWNLPWLWSGFSTRRGGLSRAYCAENVPGELNLGFTTDDDRSTVEANRRLLAEAVTGDPEMPLIVARQFHSNLIVLVSEQDIARERPRKADGILTNQPGLLLAVQVADCIPVLVADKKKRVVGAFHAGWRGTVKRIVETGVGRMRMEFGCKPKDLIAAIGPGIGQCCYSVGPEVVSDFESQFAYASELFRDVYDADPVRQKYPMLFLTQRAPGHSEIGPQTHLDLVEANRRQLLDAGLNAKSIEIIGGCTSCDRELFYSHRGSQGHAGRMMGVIGITK
jgi:YfiH family protein